ncbi:MAG: biotin--[Clostridia bacterium]|nr:biotin--[acetyl-CoA-carboxylase] ligase [Clostridia bacterium]
MASFCDDVITEEGIKAYLKGDLKDKVNAEIVSVATSTNDIVKKRGSEGEKEYFLFAAGSQTQGKGRMGRSFFSPDDTGVYFSLLLKPVLQPSQAVLITTAAAVSVCESLEKLGVQNPQIKWVNDIFVNGKKVCGILTEASFNSENGTLDYAVLGVGINIYLPKDGFPQDIEDVAGAVFSEKQNDLRNKFIAYFINSFYDYYCRLERKIHCPEYERRCMVTGKDIFVISAGEKKPAKALGVDENCGLVVVFDNGERAVLSSGEISIRLG